MGSPVYFLMDPRAVFVERANIQAKNTEGKYAAKLGTRAGGLENQVAGECMLPAASVAAVFFDFDTSGKILIT